MRRHSLVARSQSSLRSTSISSLGELGSGSGYGGKGGDPLLADAGVHGSGTDAVKPMRRELVVHKPASETFGMLNDCCSGL
jgi:hypothetical protein